MIDFPLCRKAGLPVLEIYRECFYVSASAVEAYLAKQAEKMRVQTNTIQSLNKIIDEEKHLSAEQEKTMDELAKAIWPDKAKQLIPPVTDSGAKHNKSNEDVMPKETEPVNETKEFQGVADLNCEKLEFFKASDFGREYEHVHPRSCASIANRLLKERGTVVYRNSSFNSWGESSKDKPNWPTNEKALLVCIQPVKKEWPDSWEQIGRDLLDVLKDLDSRSVEVTRPSHFNSLADRARKLAEK